MEYEVWTDGSCIKDDDRDSKGDAELAMLLLRKDQW